MELAWNGSSYTWFNKRFDNYAIQQRLDRALVSPEWQVCFPQAYLIHELLLESNHRPLILLLQPPLCH